MGRRSRSDHKAQEALAGAQRRLDATLETENKMEDNLQRLESLARRNHIYAAVLQTLRSAK